MNPLIGVLLVIVSWKVLLPAIWTVLVYTIGKKLFSKRKGLKKAGEWAIVTGSTDGIGKAYAEQLAKDGLNIMLISRNPEKLKNVATEIEKQYRVQTKTVTCDFSEADIYDLLEREINSLPSIACLVNNVGVAYPHLMAYATADWLDMKAIKAMLNCNMASVACLTRIVLPILLRQNTPGSAIINVSSYSGVHPSPYFTLYAASKAFVKHFTESLYYELEDSNVCIQTVCPLLVATAMSKIKRASFFVPKAESYVSSALDMLGVERITVGYFPHALQDLALSLHASLMPRACKDKYAKFMKRQKSKKQ